MSFINPLPLSGSDTKRRLHGKTRVLLYEELAKYKGIDELLSPYGNCFILMRIKPQFGHYFVRIFQ